MASDGAADGDEPSAEAAADGVPAPAGPQGGRPQTGVGAIVRLIKKGSTGRDSSRYGVVASTAKSKNGAVTYVLKDGLKLHESDEGTKWEWRTQAARTGGIDLSIEWLEPRVASVAMRHRLVDRLHAQRLPPVAREVTKRFLASEGARIDTQGSVVRISGDGVVATADLPCVSPDSAGVVVYSSAEVGPDGCLYFFLKEYALRGMGREGTLRLSRLQLPLRKGAAVVEVRTYPTNLGSVLHVEWTSIGPILLTEREGSGNVAQLVTWAGERVWELAGNGLPGMDWLDNVYPHDGGYVLFGTSYATAVGSLVALHCDASGKNAAEWLPARTLVALTQARFPGQQGRHKLLFLPSPSPALLLEATGEEGEEETRVCVIWRLEGPPSSMKSVRSVEMRGYFGRGLSCRPDGRVLVEVLPEDRGEVVVTMDPVSLRELGRDTLPVIQGHNEANEDNSNAFRESFVRFV